jgi:L-lactate utilization protein LutB
MNNTQPTSSHDYTVLASKESIDKAVTAFEQNSFIPYHVKTKEEALAKVQELIPENVSIMNGASATLQEIGFVDLLKSGNHKWKNLHEAILDETDPQKQALLRRQSAVSDFYVGSVHAASETGELVIASNSGSQLAHIVYTSPNLVFVVGAQKIMPTTADAIRRLEEHVVPLEDKRMMEAYGMGTTYSKTVILHKENPMMGRKIHIIIVDEKLGF